MLHAKKGEIYLAMYLHRERNFKKLLSVSIIVFSTTGIMGWTIWSYIPVIACGLTFIIQIVRSLEGKITLSDSDASMMADLRNKYVAYFNKLERLWSDRKADRITEDEASQQFYLLREISEEIEAVDNKLHIKEVSRLCDSADERAIEYFKQYHSLKIEPNA